MEPERAYPPPTFPVSLNGFYKSPPRNFKERKTKACSHFEHRDFLSKQIIIHRRFPRLNISCYSASTSPIKNRSGYMTSTEAINHKTRNISPFNQSGIFVPCNAKEAKEVISRKFCSFDGNPYDDAKIQSFKEHQDSVKKRVSGPFKSGLKGSFLTDHKAFLNSFNTFETFLSVNSSQLEVKSPGLTNKK